MREINWRGFVIAGAAALFATLAGNVQAIPMSVHDDSDAGMGVWNWRHGQSDDLAAYAFDQGNRNHGLASPPVFFLFGSFLTQNAGEPRNFDAWFSQHDRFSSERFHHGIWGVWTKSSPSTDRGGSPVSVPDGGTTAMLTGGAFCGLLLLAKRLQA